MVIRDFHCMVSNKEGRAGFGHQGCRRGGEREKSRSNLGMSHLKSSKFLKNIIHCST